ncbi:hypothetical protein FB45DRAFT_1000618 [Roridomyces roridus]|uniref:MYND-type domain-containing protein n=1 Tax=Roridomyces roridus TaxID=1738132 RepID=A0AAD7C3A7_9AGAR|nr:hypothetical protein FB45DRAFT_1000618 [Roridomyces roridus]
MNKAIVRLVPTILDYVEANRAHLRVEYLERVVCILAGAIPDVYMDPKPDPDLATLASIPHVVNFSLRVLELPDSISDLRRIFASFCSMTARHLGTVFLANPDLIDFLVAGTRSPDYHTRCFAQSALVQIYSETAWREWKAGAFQPELLRQLNPGSESLLAHGAPVLRDFLNLVQNFGDTQSGQSHCQLGHALSGFMQENPSVARGILRAPAALLKRLSTILPTIFESCEVALRGSPQSVTAADILRFELLLSRDKTEACAFARSCMERHPFLAYFYHAMTTFPDTLVAPPSCAFYVEKGLRCHASSTFIRRELLAWVAIWYHSTVTTMLNYSPNTDHLRKALVLGEKGLCHASLFMDMTAPDHSRAAEMSAVFTLFNLMSKGDILTPNELESLQERFSKTCMIARNNVMFRLPKECSALELIFARMPTAWGRWGSILSRTDSTGPRWRFGNREFRPAFSVADLKPVTEDPNGEQFLAWLEKLDTATLEEQDSEILGDPDTARRSGEAGLHRCSACFSLNAVVKRCAGCRRTRYCNNTCQRNHWKVHRQVCKAQ